VKKTRINELFHIKYPLIQGGMLWIANAELAAAVSNAGALGTVSPLAGMERHGDATENLRLQIRETRRLTEKPFAVNIPLDLPYSGILIEVILQEHIQIVVTSAGSPTFYTELLRHSGITVIHVVSSVKQAKLAESSHVDAVIVEGAEAGGHIGFDEVPLFSLLPQVVDSVMFPVIAAGGIVDARGVVAAFSLGAEGVQLGTRFVSVEECIAHPNYKNAIVEAQDTDTVITSRKLLPTRSLKTKLSHRLRDLEDSGASAHEISDLLRYSRARRAQLEGDLIEGEAFCGASAGLIKEVMTASSVIQELVARYDRVVKTLSETQ
jgi:enoyl-[acyl-carrier protein] reductase II